MEWMGVGNHKIVLHGYHVPMALLPWHYLVRVPVLNQVLPNRFPILADGLAAVVLVCAFDRVLAAIPARHAWRVPVVVAAAALILVPIIPRPVPYRPVLAPPSGWHTALSRLHLKDGASVLVLPFNAAMDDRANPMEWQAMAGTPISLVGGYCIVPDQHGRAVMCNTGRTLTRAQHASVRRMTWLVLNRPGRHGPSRPRWPRRCRRGTRRRSSPRPDRSTRLGRYLIRFFGPPTVHVGATLGWRMPTGPVTDLPAADAR